MSEGLRVCKFRVQGFRFEKLGLQSRLETLLANTASFTNVLVCEDFVVFEGLVLKGLMGYLFHKKTLTPLGPPQGPGHWPTAGSEGVAFFYKRDTPVGVVSKPDEQARGPCGEQGVVH